MTQAIRLFACGLISVPMRPVSGGTAPLVAGYTGMAATVGTPVPVTPEADGAGMASS